MWRENLAYAQKVKKLALENGASPGTSREDYEADWQERFTRTISIFMVNGAGYRRSSRVRALPAQRGKAVTGTYPPYRIPYHQRAVQQQRAARRIRANQPLLKQMYRFRTQFVSRGT